MKKGLFTMKYLLITLLFLTSLNTLAKDSINYGKRTRPLYELGGGLLYSKFPNYPGASSNREVVLPFPTAIYRGDVLRLKREEGARGIFYRGENIELDISFDGTLPSDGEDTKAREGMAKLNALIEVGPRFLYHIAKVSKNNPWDFDFHLATRVATSTGFFKEVYSRGYVLNPFFTVRTISLFKDDDLFAASIGIKYATKKWHNYYYSVDSKDVTAQRPQFKVKSGQAEISYAMLYNYPIKNDIYTFVGMIQSFYNNAANRNSPLLTKNTNTSLVVGLYWNFYKSKQTVLD